MLTLAKVMLALNPWRGRLFPELLQSRVSRQTSEVVLVLERKRARGTCLSVPSMMSQRANLLNCVFGTHRTSSVAEKEEEGRTSLISQSLTEQLVTHSVQKSGPD